MKQRIIAEGNINKATGLKKKKKPFILLGWETAWGDSLSN